MINEIEQVINYKNKDELMMSFENKKGVTLIGVDQVVIGVDQVVMVAVDW